MERFPVELLYILGFVALVVFNLIAQRAARRRQQEEQAQAPAPAAAPRVEEEPLEDIWGRRPTRAPLMPAPASRPALPPPRLAPMPRRVHPVRTRLKDKRDLRRAVILMTVLGPCRAREPPHP